MSGFEASVLPVLTKVATVVGTGLAVKNFLDPPEVDYPEIEVEPFDLEDLDEEEDEEFSELDDESSALFGGTSVTEAQANAYTTGLVNYLNYLGAESPAYVQNRREQLKEKWVQQRERDRVEAQPTPVAGN